jgi:hypothetical protein
MNNLRVTTALFAASIGLVAVAPQASADEWNKKTIVTISEPLEIPGVVLTPGTYVFKLVDSQSDRHIVIVQNERQDHTYATILAMPNYRIRPTGKTVFSFWETPEGQPKAIRAWFYPGDNFGQEFRYPKHRVTEINQVASQQVPEAPEETQTNTQNNNTEIAQNTPPPAPEVNNTPAPAPVEAAPAPAPELAQDENNNNNNNNNNVVAENNTPRTIPQTASNMPLLALCGFGLIGVALGVGAFVRRYN